jgi:hypothetical protein
MEGFGGAAMFAALQAQVAQAEQNIFEIRILGEQPGIQPLGFLFGPLFIVNGRQIMQQLKLIRSNLQRALIRPSEPPTGSPSS